MNGAPLRLVIPGWPGSFSQKWLTRVWLRDVVHDGPKMTGAAYRLPPGPVAPGTKVDKKTMRFIESMIIKSLITNPATGHKTPDKKIEVRGHAGPSVQEGADFEENQRLSLQRAATVAIALRETGYQRNIIVLGLGDSRFRHINPDLSDELRRALARRVDIIIHATTEDQ